MKPKFISFEKFAIFVTWLKEALLGKVDKEQGKSLVDDAQITKLEALEADAQENVIESISVNGVTQVVDNNKNAQVYLPINRGTTSNSAVIGRISGNTASKQYAIAEGSETTASGEAAHSEGEGTVASGNRSHAEGVNTEASGGSSHAEGQSTKATEFNAHSEGANTTASGQASHAQNSATTASGNFSTAEGRQSVASGLSSHAQNHSTTASGDYSHSEGWSSVASGQASHAQGHSTVANRLSQFVFGEYNVEDTGGDAVYQKGNYIEIVGNGLSNAMRSNARTLDWSGNETLAGKLTVGANPTRSMDVATKGYVDGELTDLKAEINKNSVAISNIPDINYTTDVLDGIEWENGTINASTGESDPDSTRRRTVGYIDVDSLESISCNIEDGYKYVLDWYKADKTFMPKISILWYPFASSFAIPSEAKYLRVLVANVNDSTASVGDEQNLSIVGEPSLHYTAKDSEKGKEYMPLVISADDFENGSFSKGNRKSANVNILRLKKPIYCKEGCDVYFDLGDLYFTLWYMDSDDPDTATIYDSISRNRNKHITVPMDCYVFVSVSKTKSLTDHIPISPTDLEGCSISFIAPPFTENIENELYLGEFVNKSTSATGQSDSTARISMTNCVALPYGDRTKLKVHINPPYVFAIRCGRVAQNLASNLYWYRDGDEIIFNNHEQYYRVIVAKLADPDATIRYTYQELAPSDLKYANLRVEYSLDDDTKDSELYDVNADNAAFFLNSQNTLSASAHGSIGSHPIVVHASDFHGDKDRLERTLRFAERAKADCVVLSGDLVANKPYDRLDWMHELFAKFNGLPIICTGNHEVLDNSYTDAMVYDYMMKNCAEKIGNTSGKTYYYTDVASKKLRIIVCDIYQYGATTRSNTHMSDEQLAYIANALATTPADYGVLMVAHSPCVDVGNLADPNYSTFFQSLRKYGFTHYDINGAPIYDIVDAFIARTSINRTYTQTGSPSSISVSADFSNVPSSVQFIAHLTGHIHEDSVCYLPTTEKQLMLNISCGCAMHGGSSYPYLADDCDITRVPYGKMQDAINVYVIDRGHKIVKITRIGGTKTYDMKDREYMAIPYKD